MPAVGQPTVGPGARVVFKPTAQCTVDATDKWQYNGNVQFELASSKDAGYATGLCITQGGADGASFFAVLQPCKSSADPTRWDQVYSAWGGTNLFQQAHNAAIR